MMGHSTDMLDNLVVFWGHATWAGKLGFVVGIPILLFVVFGWSLTWGVCHHNNKLKPNH